MTTMRFFRRLWFQTSLRINRRRASRPAPLSCPRCSATDLVRIRTFSAVARWRKRWLSTRLFACEACGWQGWRFPLSASDQALARPHASPNLVAIDDALSSMPEEPKDGEPAL